MCAANRHTGYTSPKERFFIIMLATVLMCFSLQRQRCDLLALELQLHIAMVLLLCMLGVCTAMICNIKLLC